MQYASSLHFIKTFIAQQKHENLLRKTFQSILQTEERETSVEGEKIWILR